MNAFITSGDVANSLIFPVFSVIVVIYLPTFSTESIFNCIFPLNDPGGGAKYFCYDVALGMQWKPPNNHSFTLTLLHPPL